MTISQALELVLVHQQAGRLAEAEALCRQILAVQPREAEAWHRRGIIAHQMCRYDLAVEWIRQALILNPHNGAAYSNLGEAYRLAGQTDEAIASYRRALQLEPNHPVILNNLGIALECKGELDEAIAIYRRALELRPHYAEAYSNLGNALSGQGNFLEAVASFQRAIQSQPDFAIAHSNLGATLTEHGELDQGAAALRRAIELDPNCADAWNNLGNALKDQGRMNEAASSFRRAIELMQGHAGMHSNLVHALHYLPNLDEGVIPAEQRRWNSKFADPLKQWLRPHANDRNPGRRLRIGYVSGDFRDHVVGRNLRPLFRHHDHQRFEIYCYAAVLKEDSMTEEFRQSPVQWRSSLGIADNSLAEMIRHDGIDILVDLAQHTAGNRLPVFACQPAPVRVSFAGYPESSGLEAIEYRISDPYLESKMGDEGSAERACLIDSFWCYDPCNLKVEINALPAEENGYLTFGSLNNFCKINEPGLRLWARVLHKARDSRLILLSRVGSHRERTREVLRNEGIEEHRVEFLEWCPRRAYLEMYHRLDIVLDPFPYNGHTTSLDALWMGVPVISLIGERPAARAGLSQSANLDLEELVAFSQDDYVEIATRLGHDLPRLAELRRTLRPRMKASPVMDAPRFAASIEAAYRTMWKRWCANRQS